MKKMIKNEKDNDIWDLKDDEHSLEFTFNRSIKMKKFL